MWARTFAALGINYKVCSSSRICRSTAREQKAAAAWGQQQQGGPLVFFTVPRVPCAEAGSS